MSQTRNRLTAAVACVLAVSPAARADRVDPTSTQDQADRLSIFHDYGLNVIGVDTGDGAGVGGNGGGYRGTVPVPGTPGQGAAAAVIANLQDRFTFLRGIQSTDGAGTGRSFDVSIGQASGSDSNPEARRVSPDNSSSFIAGVVSAAYHLTGGDVDPVVGSPFRADVSYTATAVDYEGKTADADAIQQGLAAAVRRSVLDNALSFSAAVNDQFTVEHGAAFLNTTDANGAIEALVTSQLSVEGGYDYGHLQYFFKPVDDRQRPTAERHTVDARLHVYPQSQRRSRPIVDGPGDGSGDHPGDHSGDALARFVRAALRRATVGYAHVWNFPDQATGTDYRYQADRFYVGLEGLTLPDTVRLFGQPIGRGTSASVLYAHEIQDYRFDNSATPYVPGGVGPGVGHPRRDALDVFTLRSNTRILDLSHGRGNLASFLQLDLVHDGANVTPRHFNEFVFSSGVTYTY